jgi:hypothetical protein
MMMAREGRPSPCHHPEFHMPKKTFTSACFCHRISVHARAIPQFTFTHMSERYKFVEGHAHFITFAVVGWVDVFTRREYAEFLLRNLAYCRKNKGIVRLVYK